MGVGYVRVSKKEQNPDLQRRELEAAGCMRVFKESISSREQRGPQLEAALDYCREGDVLVVWKLDRLGRSIEELIELVNELKDRGVGFRSLRERLDTTTPGGKLAFHVFASIAEFERNIIRERTMPAKGDGITKRKDGLYMAHYTVYTPDGPKRKTIYGRKYGEVEKKLAEARGDAARGIVFDAKGQTVGEFLERYLEEYIPSTVQHTTRGERS